MKQCMHRKLAEYGVHTNCDLCGLFISSEDLQIAMKEEQMQTGGMSPAILYEKMLMDQFTLKLYNPKASYLNKRSELITWINEVGNKLKLSKTTVQIAVSYIDFILSSNDFSPSKYQLIALTCLIIGAKYDELDQKIPMIQDFQRVSRFMYRYEIVKQAEILVLKILDWNLKIVTPLHFIMLFLAQGVVFKGDTIDGREISPNDIVIVRKYALFFNDLCLQDYSTLQFDSAVVAIACIIAARKCGKIQPIWNSKLEELTSHSWSQIDCCFSILYKKYEDVFQAVDTLMESPPSRSSNSRNDSRMGPRMGPPILTKQPIGEESSEKLEPQKTEEGRFKGSKGIPFGKVTRENVDNVREGIISSKFPLTHSESVPNPHLQIKEMNISEDEESDGFSTQEEDEQDVINQHNIQMIKLTIGRKVATYKTRSKSMDPCMRGCNTSNITSNTTINYKITSHGVNKSKETNNIKGNIHNLGENEISNSNIIVLKQRDINSKQYSQENIENIIIDTMGGRKIKEGILGEGKNEGIPFGNKSNIQI